MTERIFSTQGDVLEFLHDQGLKISRAKLSKDYREGLLPCMSDKRFREEDVRAYAESLKAPSAEEKKDKLMKARAEVESLNALISRLLKVVPDAEATTRVLEKWLDKHSDTAPNLLSDDVRAALDRIATEKATRVEEASQAEPYERNSAIAPLHYYVQGSALEPYQVTFKGEGQGLTASCSCPAGKKGKTFCKHVAWLLKGDASRLAEGSDELAALALRANGSPLLKKAHEYHFTEKQKLPAVKGISSVKDLIPLVEPMLAGTGLWSEYKTGGDGSEFLGIYLRKMYKNGKPYKNPTQMLSFSYKPVIYEAMYDELTEKIENKAVGIRTLPYLVDSTNYGKIESACASFMNKLEEILAGHVG
ncbi:SWIM zinc finger family protein [Desulfovibrio sp. ZJ200]|uniref:SWIM zinc finger family protein n=1 Tax=Desulfovibrio sp. ZJ200 TaxID=2709792 RepID=UPI0013EC10C6|nr:SWIM zinc finger family protein [Desulfovibrio sp. ZJ200]